MTAAGIASASWARTAAASLLVGILTFGALLAAMVARAPAATAADGGSAVTITAADQDPDLAEAPFPDLSVTVSQTEDLMAQGIRLTYSGGARSTRPSLDIAGANFLQVFQCWGDLEDADGNPILDQDGRPQPDRTTCQYGATGAVGQSRTATPSDPSLVAPQDASYFDAASFIPEVSIPFRSVTGKTIARVVDGVTVPDPPSLSSNEFFTRLTTNEVPWAGFGATGTGTTTFEVQTNSQAPGLGCGNPVEGAGGAVTGRSCWLVVLPRGAADPGEASVIRSGLLWDVWKHRLAVKLDFRPLGVRCALGAAERSTAGSELVAAAMASWQPALCGGTRGSIFNLIIANEADVALQANGTGVAPLALTSRALAADDVTDDLAYAPVALTGLAVVFAVDHNADAVDPDVPEEVKDLDRQPFTQMNLTPRLLAKLLTNSYYRSLPTGVDAAYLAGNPYYLTQDPDFLAVNPGWAHQSLTSPALSDVIVPLGRSDGAMAVWSYIAADPEASAFLAGEPDPWGMKVNQWATTDPAISPVGVGAQLPLDSFPKTDPSETRRVSSEPLSTVNVVTWRPYAPDFDTAAYWTLRGDGRLLGDWDSTVVPPKFKAVERAVVGEQRVLGLSDAASAAKYQVFTAALRNPAGQFVLPTPEAMSAASQAMTADSEQPQVLAFDAGSAQAAAAAAAYPLTMPVYAATNPAGGDAATRASYAAFIRYAAGAGQTPGTDLGQLPPGYAPLPESWRAQALAAADAIAAGPQTPIPTPTPTPTPIATATGPAMPPPPSVLPVVDDVPTAPEPSESAAPEPPAGPESSPTPTGPPPPVVGAASPADTSRGALGAAVPISAAGGVLAAAAVPLVSRPRRTP